MSEKTRVRFAPSPTGFLHVGGARTALFNWLYARGQGGEFVLRIEDTDRDRSSDEMVDAILEGLNWLGLDWDEGPYHQADGIRRHTEAASQLLESGAAYRCFCPPDELQAAREKAEAEGGPGSYRYDRKCAAISREDSDSRASEGEFFTVRFLIPDGHTEWEDLVHGTTRYDNADIEDFIILRTDGTPVYNLAVVSDDADMEITHVIRGDDHLSNTPKQILLYRALGKDVPLFAHVPMILGADGKRLSKRHGATAVGEYREQGILPQALNNFLALLGWNPGDDQEIMQEHELIARFSLDRINKKSAIFDPEKLAWMNGQHLQLAPSHELVALLAPQLTDAGLTSDEEIAAREDWFAQVVDLLKTRGRTLPDIAGQMAVFLAAPTVYDASAVERQWKDRDAVRQRLETTSSALKQVDNWRPETIEDTLRTAAASLDVGFGKLVQPLRLALTGGLASPGIDQVVFLLGKDEALRRIDSATNYLEESAG